MRVVLINLKEKYPKIVRQINIPTKSIILVQFNQLKKMRGYFVPLNAEKMAYMNLKYVRKKLYLNGEAALKQVSMMKSADHISIHWLANKHHHMGEATTHPLWSVAAKFGNQALDPPGKKAATIQPLSHRKIPR